MDIQRVRRHAVAAAKIAAIDYRNSQIPQRSRQDILYWRSTPAIHVVDTKHLSVGKDEVVRYTLVARSNSGASNVSFEGIRCTLNGDYKIYGYGTGNRLKPAAEMDWRRVGKSGPESYRDDLWRYHFPDGRDPA